MRKIVASLFISLDGVYEAPDQWHFPYFNDEMGQEVGADVEAGDTLLFGRQTYDEFVQYWPHQGSEVELADFFNQTPKLVVSNTLKSSGWQGTTIISGDVAAELNRVKQGPGKNINIVGSGTLVRSLLKLGVLDELHLLIHPIAVNSGKRLFEGAGPGLSADPTSRTPLQVIRARTLSTGVLAVHYAPAPAAS